MKHLPYTAFAQAIQAHPDVRAGIPLRTWKRYEEGDVPRSIRLLFDHPAVFATLVDLLHSVNTAELPKGYGQSDDPSFNPLSIEAQS